MQRVRPGRDRAHPQGIQRRTPGPKDCGRHCPLLSPERHVGLSRVVLGDHPRVRQEGKADGEDGHPGEGVPKPEDRSERGGRGAGGVATGDGPLPREAGGEARDAELS